MNKKLSINDKSLLEKVIKNNYEIIWDNDDVWVINPLLEGDNYIDSFECFGRELVIKILDYFNIDSDFC